MGMFDHLVIEVETPEVPYEIDTRAQTKTFECVGTTYTIRDDKLFRTYRTFRKTGEMATSFITGASYPKYEIEEEWEGRTEYHGDVHITTNTPDGMPGLVRLIARFSYGVLEWIREDEQAMEMLRELKIESEEDRL